jgi:hypothetical protein
LALVLSFPTVAFAAGGPEVAENYAEVDFPASITFHLSVSSGAVIDDIELEYGLTRITCGLTSAKARPDLNPSTEVQVSWEWDLRNSGSLPPGARIWWRWRIEDEAGNELVVKEQTVAFDDPHHDWQEMRSSELTLFTAVPDQEINQALWEAANEALDRLESDLGARPKRPVRIYNYPNTQALRDAVVYTHEWTGGLAFPSYDTVLLGANRSNLEWGVRTVAHELAHVVIYQVTYNCLGGMPTWLNEGLATYVEGELEDYQQKVLDEATAKDDLISLRSLGGGFPTSSKRARLAYAQSNRVVSYLIETYGPDKMAELLQAFKEGTTFDRALLGVYGLDVQGLDNEWRASLGLPPRQAIAIQTPTRQATRVPYGAGALAPTATVVWTPTPTSLPPTATFTAVPTATPIATQTPTARPTDVPSPTPTLVMAALGPKQSGTPLLWWGIGAVVTVCALSTAIVWIRRLHRRPHRLSTRDLPGM